MKTTTLTLALCAALAACSHAKPAEVKTTPPTTTNDTPKQDKPAPVVTKDTQVSPGISVAGDVASMCGLKAMPGSTGGTGAAAPKFDYDKDELTADDRNVLDQLATCMMTGPLKGKAVALIGRADPRGTDEYNLGLGSRRASTVGSYLQRLGVGQPQLAVTTRGSLEATGTDEATWKTDRRVDVQLKVD